MSNYQFNPFKSVWFFLFLLCVFAFFCAFGYIVG